MIILKNKFLNFFFWKYFTFFFGSTRAQAKSNLREFFCRNFFFLSILRTPLNLRLWQEKSEGFFFKMERRNKARPFSQFLLSFPSKIVFRRPLFYVCKPRKGIMNGSFLIFFSFLPSFVSLPSFLPYTVLHFSLPNFRLGR